MKPPAKLKPQPKKCSNADDNEEKKGTAIEDDLFPCKVEACCKVHKPGGCINKRAGADDHKSHKASARMRAAGDFGTQCMQEHQVILAVANQTLVARMFISLGLNNKMLMPLLTSRVIIPPRNSVIWTKRVSSSLSLSSANLVE